MSEFLQLLPPDEARSRLLSRIDGPPLNAELVATTEALGRVSSEDILAPHALPQFPRSTVDGYALKARDSFGASASLPAYIALIGEVAMGSVPKAAVQPGQCLLIHTGGMLPDGADAVVMLENTQRVDPTEAPGATIGEIEIMRAVAEGENVIAVGEDVRTGDIVIRRGSMLRPQEIGGLMALGITSTNVVRRPRVAIISSGDEVVEPWQSPLPGQVRDVNAYSLSALVRGAGGDPVFMGIVGDERGRAEAVARTALVSCDMVIITAGSSASARDLTAGAIAALGEPGVLVHGVNIRPGKPTILGVCNGKPVIGLPGNPVSALVIARLFVEPVLLKMLGRPEIVPRGVVRAQLAANLASQTGREDWWPVRLETSDAPPSAWRAEPIFGRSNLIFTLVAADGLVRVEAEKNGIPAGELVDVELF